MPKNRGWSYSEEKILIDNFKDCTIKELMGLFPNRTQVSINNKIKKLKAGKKIVDVKDEEVIKRAYSQRKNKE